MIVKYFPAVFHSSKFNCPNCGVFATQQWHHAYIPNSYLPDAAMLEVAGLDIARCIQCDTISIWYNEEMILPDTTGIELANEDLPEDIIDDYNEAASIIQRSPRGAAALLRLAIQKLCAFLGQRGKKIDADIAALVAKGLPIQVQQALDIVRVIGNEAVHPGTIDLKDDIETATELFGLINLIADIMISQPKHVATMYASLPEDKRKAIEKRDGKS